MRPLLRLIATAVALAVTGSAWAQAGSVQRCEGKDRKVTYSNTQCPPGTTPVRTVNTDPPVSVEDRKAAQEQARKEAAAAKQSEKDQARQEARERKQADDRAKAEAKTNERCERARRDLERAKTTRAELGAQAATLEALQKADREIGRREADVARDCPR